jgi:hypothetical protein
LKYLEKYILLFYQQQHKNKKPRIIRGFFLIYKFILF